MSRPPASSFLRVHDPEGIGQASRRHFLVAGASAIAAAAVGSPLSSSQPGTPPGMLFETAQGLSPLMTLTQFFADWFLPVVLVGDAEVRASTIKLYRDALDWWRIVTGDPPVCQITDQMLARFKAELQTSTYKRGRTGRPTQLARATIAKHLKVLRAVIYRLGPQLDARRPTAGLLPRTPIVPGLSVKFKLKPCFTLDEARQIAVAAASFDRPRLADLPTPVFWRRLLGTWYFTGLRSGTVEKLTHGCIELRDGRLWLDVPDEAVTKTDKGLSLWMHPELAAMFDLQAPPDTPLVPRAGHYRTLIDLHQQLQAAAGLPPERQFSPHAWRRMHGDQMKLLGIDAVGEILRVSLDHGDVKTSTTHYSSVVNELRMRLPTLWPDQQVG